MWNSIKRNLIYISPETWKTRTRRCHYITLSYFLNVSPVSNIVYVVKPSLSLNSYSYYVIYSLSVALMCSCRAPCPSFHRKIERSKGTGGLTQQQKEHATTYYYLLPSPPIRYHVYMHILHRVLLMPQYTQQQWPDHSLLQPGQEVFYATWS